MGDSDTIFSGGGETGALMRQIDWSHTPLGPPQKWSQTLRTLVPVMLASRFPMRIMWGQDLTLLYNDDYRSVLGPNKHPSAMGVGMEKIYSEIWGTVGPVFARVMLGESVAQEDTLLNLFRKGYLEECYFTLSYSPLRDDMGAIAGILGVVHETTERVLAERRLLSLRELAAAAGQGKTVEQACWLLAAALQKNNADVPFALLYLSASDGKAARLAAQVGLDSTAGQATVAPVHLALDGSSAWGLDGKQAALIVNDLGTLFPPITAGPYTEPIRQAIVLRLTRRGAARPYGFLIAGINPRQALDDDYQAFFELASEHLVTALANSLALSDAEHARNRLYRQFMQAPVAVSLVAGPEHVYELANPRYEEMVGRTSLQGKSVRAAFPELADNAPLFEMLRAVRASGVPFEAEEYGLSLRRKGDADGALETVYFKFTCQPMLGEDNEVEAILTVAVDVTAQVVARQERATLLAREREFRAEAEIANRAKDEFLAMLGHELRNPLAPILTALQLMRLRGDASLERERAIIERQVGHVTRLVDDLLDVSRITRGTIEIKREPLEIAEVIAKAVEIASPLIDQRQHRLRVEVNETGLMVDGDAVRLAQVVSNLLTNAAKYTEPGGTIDLSARPTSEGVTVRVADSGIGLSQDMLTRIFEPFVQERQDSDRSQGGLGLGLAIVRAFTHLHGGTIIALSDGPGTGTEFYLTLPFSSGVQADDRRHEPRAVEVAPAQGLCVLVVDDNVDAAELLAESLAVVGYATAMAHDGPSALRIAQSLQVDIAVLDIGLPVMDGYELGRHLREMPAYKDLPLVALTGYGQSSDRERSRVAGFNGHLVKPIHLAELRALLASLTVGGGPKHEP